MTTSINVAAMEQGNTAQQTTGRPVIYGTQGVISSGHYLTSMAGMRMLLSGGNAFDALVAAGFAAAVTEPIACVFAGGRGRLHAVPRRKRRPAIPKRAGHGAEIGDGRLVSLSRSGGDTHRAGPAGASELHGAGRGGGAPLDVGALRHEDSGRGARTVHSLCRPRHSKLRVHAGTNRQPRHEEPVRPVPAGWDGRLLRGREGSGSRLASGSEGLGIDSAKAGGGRKRRRRGIVVDGVQRRARLLLHRRSGADNSRLRTQRGGHTGPEVPGAL